MTKTERARGVIGRHPVAIISAIGLLLIPPLAAFLVLLHGQSEDRANAVQAAKARTVQTRRILQQLAAATQQRNAVASDVDVLRAQLEANGVTPVAPPSDQTIDSIPTPRIGPAGPPGASIVGPPGPRGLPGVPGKAGTDGIPGVAGTPGEIGDPGPKGDTGPAGTAGADGKNGADGAVGPKGDPGDAVTGPAGPAGPPGPAGADGAPGATGADGAQGPQGPAGPACPAGFTATSVQLLTADQAVISALVCVADPPAN